MNNIRVRFAPSPTGALHIGGIRTALFNYLFAKKNGGKFILRIEDTDQKRYVDDAENYIIDSLNWLGITPDESPVQGGSYGPYRQSERKEIYQQYVDKLLAEDKAYYAFDTAEELDEMRQKLQESRIANPQYDTITRTTMKNSLTLSSEEVEERISSGEPYVIRIKVPEKEDVRLKDLVRGWVKVNSEILDDKVLMKSDGMPTYHLANVVDDYLMKISHVIRGEEWLPSAPIHVLLYESLGWEEEMPEFGHLPLILKPDGNGKLSKRAADKAGFPIFPLNWTDSEGTFSEGFKEIGFIPEALTNFLAFLGWNPGTEQELFSLEELVETFSIERVNKGGTKFDFEKAKWFNQQYIKTLNPDEIGAFIKKTLLKEHQIECDLSMAIEIFMLLRERVTFPNEFIERSLVLFNRPEVFDEKTLRKKWKDDTEEALMVFADSLLNQEINSSEEFKNQYWLTLETAGFKPGQYMPVLRLALTGDGSGPDLMQVLFILGSQEVRARIIQSIPLLKDKLQ